MNLKIPKNVFFECQRCALCCGDTSRRGRNILLLESEVQNISQRTGLKPIFFAMPIPSNGPYRYRMKKKNGKCIFLDGKACRIYGFRPLICRFYPFSLTVKNGTYVFEVSEECPGVGLGQPVPEKHFKTMAEKALKMWNSKGRF